MVSPGGFSFVSPSGAYEETIAVRDAALAGSWSRVSELLDGLSDAGARGWVMRAVAEDAPHLTIPIADVESRHGRLLTILSAHCLVQQAWRARSHASAAQVSREQFARFRDFLVRAERLLVEIVAVAPSTIEAWDLRITTSRGLELGRGESQRRYDQLVSLDQENVPAQRGMLQELCPKWHGDWPAAFELARAVTSAARPGTLGPMVLLDAHLEGWAEHGVDYLRQAGVIEEVIAAAGSSVMHPEFVPVVGWREAHSNFALFFSLAEMPGHAAAHFHAIGDVPVEATWAYFEHPQAQFERRRHEAMSAGAHR